MWRTCVSLFLQKEALAEKKKRHALCLDLLTYNVAALCIIFAICIKLPDFNKSIHFFVAYFGIVVNIYFSCHQFLTPPTNHLHPLFFCVACSIRIRKEFWSELPALCCLLLLDAIAPPCTDIIIICSNGVRNNISSVLRCENLHVLKELTVVLKHASR